MPKLPDDLFVADRRHKRSTSGRTHYWTLGLMALTAALFFALI